MPDGEAVQWCEVTKPGLVGMLFGLSTLGSFGRVLRVKSFWLVWKNLDRQVMFQLKRRDPSDVEQDLLLKLLRDVPPAQVHDVLLEAVAV